MWRRRWRRRGSEGRWIRKRSRSALICEHLEVKPIIQNARSEIHRGRKLRFKKSLTSTPSTALVPSVLRPQTTFMKSLRMIQKPIQLVRLNIYIKMKNQK